MMLEYLGYIEQARALEIAIEQTYREGKTLTADQGGTATTLEFVEAVKHSLTIPQSAAILKTYKSIKADPH